METQVTWKGKMSFMGASAAGFSVPLGTSTEAGGDNDGFSPMELLLVGLCGCTAMDVISILNKKRQEVTDFDVKASAERTEEHPKIFTHILLEYVITGKNIDRAAVERAVELSATKYCPAQFIMGKSAVIEHKITIIESGQ